MYTGAAGILTSRTIFGNTQRSVHSSQASPTGLITSPHPHTPTTPTLFPHSLTSSPPQHPLSSSTTKQDLLNFVDKGIIENVSLPGLTVEDIEAVLSENSDWSGQQIEQFLRSAVDLSEIEAKLFSVNGYESDSGYSTYDVSPITGTSPLPLPHGGPPPLQVGAPFSGRSLSPALTPVDPSPLINISPTATSFPLPPPPHHHHISLHPLPLPPPHHSHPHHLSQQQQQQQHDLLPVTTDITYFHSAPPSYTPQDNLFPVGSSYPMFLPFSSQQDYPTSCPILSGNNSCFPDFSSAANTFSSEFTDLLASTSSPGKFSILDGAEPFVPSVNCRRSSDGQLSFSKLGVSRFDDLALPETRSLPNLGDLSKEVHHSPLNEFKPLHLLPPNEIAVSSSMATSIASPLIKMEGGMNECAYSGQSENSSPVDNASKPATSPNSLETTATANTTSPINDNSTSSLPLPPLVSVTQSEPTDATSSSPDSALTAAVATDSDSTTDTNADPTGVDTVPDTPLPSDISSVLNVPGNSLQSLLSMCSQMPVLDKLLASSNNPMVFLLAISTALSTLSQPPQGANGTKTQAPIDLAQLQTLVAKIGASQLEKMIAAKQDAINAMSGSDKMSSSLPPLPGSQPAKQAERKVIASLLPPTRGVGNGDAIQSNNTQSPEEPRTSNGYHRQGACAKSSLPKSRSRLHKTSSRVAMKTSQKKKSTWPRSMNKANLLAFREHILNRLKKSHEGGEAGMVSPIKQIASTPDSCGIVSTDAEPCSHSMKNTSTSYEYEVTYERNHLGEQQQQQRCSSEPATITSSLSGSPVCLQSSQSTGNVGTAGTDRIPQLSDFLLQSDSDCEDLLADFQFNPDTLLSSSVLSFPDNIFDGLMSSDDDREDDTLAFNGLDSQSPPKHLLQSDMDCTSFGEFLSSPTDLPSTLESTGPTSSSSTPLPLPPSFRYSPTSRNSPICSPVAGSPVLAIAQSSCSTVTETHSQQNLPHLPCYSFPELNSIHGSADNVSTAGPEGECKFQFQVQSSLDTFLQTHRDPLLNGGGYRSNEPLEF